MSRTGRRLLTYEQQLREIGIQLNKIQAEKLGSKVIGPKGINLTDSLATIDLIEVTNRYKWSGLPEYLPQWLVEQMLYYRGSLCGFIHYGKLMILPFAKSGDINAYGLPTKVQPISYNGEYFGNLSMIVDYTGGFNKNAKTALIYDHTPAFACGGAITPRATLNSDIINHMNYILERANISLTNGTKKGVVFVENEAQANAMRDDVENSLQDESPVIVTVKGIAGTNELESFSAIELQLEQLMNYYSSINNLRCSLNGVKNSGTVVKKERIVVGELSGQEVQTNLVWQDGLVQRQLFVDSLKKIYPDNDIIQGLSVELNTEIYRDIAEELSVENDNKDNERIDDYGDSNFAK